MAAPVSPAGAADAAAPGADVAAPPSPAGAAYAASQGVGAAAPDDNLLAVFDQLIAESGGATWNALEHAEPMPATEGGHGVQALKAFMEPFPSGTGKKNFKVVVDFMIGWTPPSGFTLEALGVAMKCGAQSAPAEALPDGIRPAETLLPGDVMQIIVEETSPGVYDVLKHFTLQDNASGPQAARLCSGVPMRLPRRANTVGAKKAFQMMLQGAKGWKMLFARSTIPPRGAAPGDAAPGDAPKGPKGEWAPTAADIRSGRHFIMEYAPPNGTVDQMEWILTYNKAVDSPIRGWPTSFIYKFCELRAKQAASAKLETGFPLTVYDMKDVLVNTMVPAVARTMLDHGVFVIGRAGVGKTPFVFILATAIGQYWVDMMDVGAKPGWYRGKQFDDFKGIEQQVYHGAIIDDGKIPKFAYEDIKQFMDSGFQGHVDCRYAPVSFAKNSMRAIVDNTWDPTMEPPNPVHGGTLSWDVFYGMVKPSFDSVPEEHLLAILKRGPLCIAGYHGAYFRLPSASKDEPIHIIASENVGDNWFKTTNMHTYGTWKKQGASHFPPGFDEAYAEQTLLFGKLLVDEQGADGAAVRVAAPVPNISPGWGVAEAAALNEAGSAGPPGWWPLVPQDMKNALQAFVVESVARRGAVAPSLALEMKEEFGIDPLAAYQVIRFAIAFADVGAAQSAGAGVDLEAELGRALEDAGVAEEGQLFAVDEEASAALAERELADARMRQEAAWDEMDRDAAAFLGDDLPPSEKGIQYLGAAPLLAEKNAELSEDASQSPKRRRMVGKQEGPAHTAS